MRFAELASSFLVAFAAPLIRVLLKHLMNLERDNYLRVDDDKRPQARAEEANDDSGDEDEGSFSLNSHCNCFAGIVVIFLI